jgi:hypothetical protein
MKLTATLTDTTATVMTISGGATGSTKFGGAMLLTDIYILSSADTSVSISISDGTEVVFAITSGDYTSATPAQQKNEANSNFKKLVCQGPLTVTATGISSGNVIVNATVIPLN